MNIENFSYTLKWAQAVHRSYCDSKTPIFDASFGNLHLVHIPKSKSVCLSKLPFAQDSQIASAYRRLGNHFLPSSEQVFDLLKYFIKQKFLQCFQLSFSQAIFFKYFFVVHAPPIAYTAKRQDRHSAQTDLLRGTWNRRFPPVYLPAVTRLTNIFNLACSLRSSLIFLGLR